MLDKSKRKAEKNERGRGGARGGRGGGGYHWPIASRAKTIDRCNCLLFLFSSFLEHNYRHMPLMFKFPPTVFVPGVHRTRPVLAPPSAVDETQGSGGSTPASAGEHACLRQVQRRVTKGSKRPFWRKHFIGAPHLIIS